jgi:hypothetical protein
VTKRIAAALLLVAIALPLHADFKAVARAIDAQAGVKRVWIPFLGIARAVVWVVQPEGIHDFQLVTFEGASRLDPRELQQTLREKIGAGFRPLVQVYSRRSGEWSFIYAKPSENGRRIELVVLAHDNDDTVLVRVVANPDIIARHIREEPRHVHRVAGR